MRERSFTPWVLVILVIPMVLDWVPAVDELLAGTSPAIAALGGGIAGALVVSLLLMARQQRRAD